MRDTGSILVPIARGRPGRPRRELALGVAAGRMSERAFFPSVRRLNSEEARLVEDARPCVGIDPAEGDRLHPQLCVELGEPKPPTRAFMIQSLYEEVVVRGT